MIFLPHEREQFLALTRAFLARFFENEITSGTDDLKTSFFWLLSFLAVPGLFMPMTMAFTWQLVAMIKGPEALRVLTRGDKAFYLGFAMIATASITAIAWNSLLADRRDGLVLGVLPVRPLVIVAARLGALSLYVTLVGVAMNALASLSFGLFLASGSTFVFALRGAAAHFIASVGASACVFLCVAGIQGVALAAFGPRIFARLAPLMQLTLVGLVVAGFLMLPAIDVSVVDTLANRGHEVRPWILSMPPLWFLGLYEVVLGTNDPLFHDLARQAMLVTAAGLIATVCSYPLAYRRVMIAVVQEGSTAGLASRLRSARSYAGDRPRFRHPCCLAVLSCDRGQGGTPPLHHCRIGWRDDCVGHAGVDGDGVVEARRASHLAVVAVVQRHGLSDRWRRDSRLHASG